MPNPQQQQGSNAKAAIYAVRQCVHVQCELVIANQELALYFCEILVGVIRRVLETFSSVVPRFVALMEVCRKHLYIPCYAVAALDSSIWLPREMLIS